MENNTYLKAMELFEVIPELQDVVRLMLSDEEVQLIVLMDKEKYTK